jgi:hypothetical protein
MGFEGARIGNTETQRTQRMKAQNSVLSVTLCFKTRAGESAKLEAAIRANLEGLGYDN